MELLKHQIAFTESVSPVTVLCGQRGSGRTTAAIEVAQKYRTKPFVNRSDFRRLVSPCNPDKLRGLSNVVIDDFDLLEFDCAPSHLAAMLTAIKRVFLTIGYRDKNEAPRYCDMVVSAIPDKRVIFAGTHENTFLPFSFIESLYFRKPDGQAFHGKASVSQSAVIARWLYARSDELTQIAEGESLSASQAYFGKAEAYREIAEMAEREGWTRTR